MPTSADTHDKARHPATFTAVERRLHDKLTRVSALADDLRALVEECLATPESVYTACYGDFGAESIRTDLVASPRDLSILRDTIDGYVRVYR